MALPFCSSYHQAGFDKEEEQVVLEYARRSRSYGSRRAFIKALVLGYETLTDIERRAMNRLLESRGRRVRGLEEELDTIMREETARKREEGAA
jgi:hypothetical protein